MRNKNYLLIEQLDQKLNKFNEAGTVIVPTKGWVNTIRTSLNMTRAQLASTLGVTPGAIQKIEAREATGQITINKLRDAGKSLDMKLVYGFVPYDESIDNLVNKKATALARRIVLRTHQTMKLEDQAIADEKIEKSIRALASEIKSEMRKSLWD